MVLQAICSLFIMLDMDTTIAQSVYLSFTSQLIPHLSGFHSVLTVPQEDKRCQHFCKEQLYSLELN